MYVPVARQLWCEVMCYHRKYILRGVYIIYGVMKCCNRLLAVDMADVARDHSVWLGKWQKM